MIKFNINTTLAKTKHSEKPENSLLSAEQIATFYKQGYLKLPNALASASLQTLRESAVHAYNAPALPWELEADVGYPGAPNSAESLGGRTVRRLLGAYERSPLWADLATHPIMNALLQALFQGNDIYLSQTHHNCLMTKHPQYSSDTGWHQDIRYWSFADKNLISAWFALGPETQHNGCLQVVPGSHLIEYRADQFDDKTFFKPDLAENQMSLQQATAVELAAGDLLLFHSRLLHAASRNHSDDTKLALVFTYFKEGNHAIAGTRSDSQKAIKLT